MFWRVTFRVTGGLVVFRPENKMFNLTWKSVSSSSDIKTFLAKHLYIYIYVRTYICMKPLISFFMIFQYCTVVVCSKKILP